MKPNYIHSGSLSARIRSHSATPIGRLFHKIADSFFLSKQSDSDKDVKSTNVWTELTDIGFSQFQLDRHESYHIESYLHSDEHIKATIRGHTSGVGGVLVAATESRLLYLHSIPLFSSFEEFSYEVISGVSINREEYLSDITIYTQYKTYTISFINSEHAENFIDYISQHIYHPDLRGATQVGREALMK